MWLQKEESKEKYHVKWATHKFDVANNSKAKTMQSMVRRGPPQKCQRRS